LCFTGDLDEVSVSRKLARNIYRIGQEAFTNIARHANARELRLDFSSVCDGFAVTIADDGIGFDPTRPPEPRAAGLLGMRERSRLIGAKLEICSARGKGTVVRLVVPNVARKSPHP